jgi:hypothetical protein
MCLIKKTPVLKKRIRAIRVIRSHALFLIEQVKRWAETRGRYGQGIMDQLITHAYLQVGRYDWNLARIQEIKDRK